jgi:hypothetical protein
MTKDKAARFREQAEECRQQAARTLRPLDKEAWLRLAMEWTKLAQASERGITVRPLSEAE